MDSNHRHVVIGQAYYDKVRELAFRERRPIGTQLEILIDIALSSKPNPEPRTTKDRKGTYTTKG